MCVCCATNAIDNEADVCTCVQHYVSFQQIKFDVKYLQYEIDMKIPGKRMKSKQITASIAVEAVAAAATPSTVRHAKHRPATEK